MKKLKATNIVNLPLWRIYVPTQMELKDGSLWPITTKYHQVWDQKVRKIAGGLSIHGPIKGQWVQGTVLFAERMIPVEIMCSKENIEQISDMTADYYNQEAIMYSLISNESVIREYSKCKSQGATFSELVH